MAKTVHGRAVKAKAPTEEGFGGFRTAIRSADPILLTAREIWPHKTAVHLAAACGVTARCAELWLAGTTQMARGAYLALLWSEHGARFLEAGMTGTPRPPCWWLSLRRELQISEARAAEIAARKARERLEAGDDA